LWGSEYGTIQLWRGPKWEPRGTLYIDSRGVSRIAFNPNGQNFAAAFSSLELEHDSSVEIFNTTTWEITRTLQLGTSMNIEFSPDGTLLASVPDRYATKMWQMNGGRLAYNLRTAFTDAVNSLAFSSDGTILATGHYDGSLRLWNSRSGELIQTMQSEGVVESLAFSPLNNLLATGGSFRNSEVRLWDLETGKPVRILPGHTHGVDRLAFSPDGRLLASASYDGSVRLWGVRPGAVLSLLGNALSLPPNDHRRTLPAISRVYAH
jgi:WD40 repeat protein